MDNLKQLKYIIPFVLIGGVILYFLLGKITEDSFKQFPLIKSGEPVNSLVLETKEYKGTTLLKDTRVSIRPATYYKSKNFFSMPRYRPENRNFLSSTGISWN